MSVKNNKCKTTHLCHVWVTLNLVCMARQGGGLWQTFPAPSAEDAELVLTQMGLSYLEIERKDLYKEIYVILKHFFNQLFMDCGHNGNLG